MYQKKLTLRHFVRIINPRRGKGEIIMAVDPEAVKAFLEDPTTLARFVANPKAVSIEMGIDVDDPAQAGEMERLARTWQGALGGVAKASGINVAEPRWGIGAGCCNDKALAFR